MARAMPTPASALFALLPLTLLLSPGDAFSLTPGTAVAPFASQVARIPPRNPYWLVASPLLGLADAYPGGKGALRLLHHAEFRATEEASLLRARLHGSGCSPTGLCGEQGPSLAARRGPGASLGLRMQNQVPPWRQLRGKWMVSSVNSRSNATSRRWHLWEIDLRFALNSTPGWSGVRPTAPRWELDTLWATKSAPPRGTCRSDREILVEQQPPQGVFVCDHAGLVIN